LGDIGNVYSKGTLKSRQKERERGGEHLPAGAEKILGAVPPSLVDAARKRTGGPNEMSDGFNRARTSGEPRTVELREYF